MPKRSVRYRGFGLTAEVPERLGRAIRKLVPKPEPIVEKLSFQALPPVAIDARHAEREAMRDFLHRVAPDFAEAARQKDQLAAHPWYHTIELPDGTVTPGRFDHRELEPRYGLPDDLSGKRALDVGSGDGYWAFALERRGAQVTSLDIETFADVDLPPALHAMFVEQPLDLSFRAGLKIARERLGSNVQLVNKPVYALDPAEVGTFDFVHAGDILLHVRDPILALQRVRAVTSGEFLLADLFDPQLDELGAGPNLTRYRGGWLDAQWWAPALSTLTQMVADAGFSDVQLLTTYSLSDLDDVPGPRRAVIRARP